MKPNLPCLALLALLPLTAEATNLGHLDLYYVPAADFAAKGDGLVTPDDRGDGLGVRGLVPVSANAALSGEYQKTDYDLSGRTYLEYRAGLAFFMGPTGAVIIEYVDSTLEDGDAEAPADGFAAHLQADFPLGEAEAYGRAGYVKLEDDSGADLKGFEYTTGVTTKLSPSTRGFVDFRSTTLESSAPGLDKVEFNDLRIGLRVLFK